MERNKKIILIILIAAAAGGATWFLLPSREDKVRAQFARSEALLNREAEESPITVARKALKFSALAAEPCWAETPIQSLSGELSRQQITANVGQLRTMFSTLTVDFDELDFEVTFPEDDLAEVSVSATVVGASNTVGSVNEQYQVTCELRKIEGDWLFSNVKVKGGSVR